MLLETRAVLDHNKFLACQPFEKRTLIFREALLVVLACAAPYTLSLLTSHLELPDYGQAMSIRVALISIFPINEARLCVYIKIYCGLSANAPKLH